MHSWQGGGVISTTITTTKTRTKKDNDDSDNDDVVDKDNDNDPNGEDNYDLIFGTTTNLWSDAFLAEGGVILTMTTT